MGKIINFKDMKVEYAERYKVIEDDGTEKTKTIQFLPGTVYQQGTKEAAENFNAIQKNCIYEVVGTKTIEGQTEVYDITIEGSDDFEFETLKIIMKASATNTKNAVTVRLNGDKYTLTKYNTTFAPGTISANEKILVNLIKNTLVGEVAGMLKSELDRGLAEKQDDLGLTEELINRKNKITSPSIFTSRNIGGVRNIPVDNEDLTDKQYVDAKTTTVDDKIGKVRSWEYIGMKDSDFSNKTIKQACQYITTKLKDGQSVGKFIGTSPSNFKNIFSIPDDTSLIILRPEGTNQSLIFKYNNEISKLDGYRKIASFNSDNMLDSKYYGTANKEYVDNLVDTNKNAITNRLNWTTIKTYANNAPRTFTVASTYNEILVILGADGANTSDGRGMRSFIFPRPFIESNNFFVVTESSLFDAGNTDIFRYNQSGNEFTLHNISGDSDNNKIGIYYR